MRNLKLNRWIHPLWRHPCINYLHRWDWVPCGHHLRHKALFFQTWKSGGNWLENVLCRENRKTHPYTKRHRRRELCLDPRRKDGSWSLCLYNLPLRPQEWLFLRLKPQLSQRGKRQLPIEDSRSKADCPDPRVKLAEESLPHMDWMISLLGHSDSKVATVRYF